MKRHVRHVLKDENPTIWVGKDGLTAQSVAEIEKQLQRNKMVKVRILPAALKELTTAEDIAKKAAAATEAALVEVRGHVFILFRKRRTDGSAQQATQDKSKPPATEET
jgi:putative YhbY family RNA-binding protein